MTIKVWAPAWKEMVPKPGHFYSEKDVYMNRATVFCRIDSNRANICAALLPSLQAHSMPWNIKTF
jgi:hypothetical protein